MQFSYIINLVSQASVIEVHSMTEQSVVPAPGDIVTAMVTTVNQRLCKCVIKCVGDIVLTRPYRGILRKEDVRATEKDRVQMYNSFRPGDIILARVVTILHVAISISPILLIQKLSPNVSLSKY